jgi:tetratricopeptide (TPR) repeat protein
MLAPVLGLLDMAFMQYSLVSDHLQYAAMPSVIALIAGVFTAMLAWARRRWPRAAPPAGATAMTAILLMLTVLTWRRSQTFRNEETLWSHTIRLNDRAWPAYNNLGVVRRDKGDYRQALAYLTRAIEVRPDYAEAYNNRGTVFGAEGDIIRAIKDFDRAIALKPDYVAAYSNRGTAYAIAGDYDRAIADLTRAIELRPDLAAAYNNRGNVCANKGDFVRAVGDFTRAIELKPDYADAYRNRAAAFGALAAYDQAWADVKMCRRLGAPPPPELIRALVAATGRSE